MDQHHTDQLGQEGQAIQPRFCKTCKWFKPDYLGHWDYDKCDNIKLKKRSMHPQIYAVSGRIPDLLCRVARVSEDLCGQEGKYWERRVPIGEKIISYIRMFFG